MYYYMLNDMKCTTLMYMVKPKKTTDFFNVHPAHLSIMQCAGPLGKDGAGSLDLRVDVGLVLLKRLLEHATQLVELGLEGSLVWPDSGRVEDF